MASGGLSNNTTGDSKSKQGSSELKSIVDPTRSNNESLMIPVSRDQWAQQTRQVQRHYGYSQSGTTAAWMYNQDQYGPYHALGEVNASGTYYSPTGYFGNAAPSAATQGSSKSQTKSYYHTNSYMGGHETSHRDTSGKK
ncbi:hypothetical protein AAE478_001000 [Parahypoxylon ruwenzoriense]